MQESYRGLASAEAQARMREYGPNAIEEKRRSFAASLIGWTMNPMSLMFVAAGALSLWSGNGADAGIIAVLFATNIGVGAWHESKADTAVAKLREKLSVMVKVSRDGSWRRLPSSDLVPGDEIQLSVGDLIPADISFMEAKNVTVNESAVTGESLPVEKRAGDASYSGAYISTGIAYARVTATGPRTYFGSTLALVDGRRKKSSLERDIISISRFLSLASIAVMSVLTALLIAGHQPVLDIAALDAALLIAGIPVALPTVMTLIISVGVLALARRSAIVRRLSSLEDLADVDLLLSDKTGTLTENRIVVAKMAPIAADMSERDIWARALAAAPSSDANPMDAALRAKAMELGFAALPADDFIPGDSERKRATAFIAEAGARVAVVLGAPQTVESLCAFADGERARYDALAAEAAQHGYRVLSLAEGADDSEQALRPLAVFLLADAVRSDAKQTMGFMREHGISVKMVTGDGYDVAAHVAHELGMEGRIVRRRELRAGGIEKEFPRIGGFAEVMPKDKYDIVMMAHAAARPYVVAVTGDGVNDVPPVKAADVGIAVANAVDALKGAADIVLTASGIAAVKDAIIESRKIFTRLYNYSIYRIAESFRLIVTIAIIGALFHTFPLSPVQIILIAILNDVPIISLAFDRVAVPRRPAAANARRRIALSLAFGAVGVANSMILLWLAAFVFHAPWEIIQTLFFLKLTVSGHMLVYVAHTDQPWYRFLPSRQVIWATSATQAIATALALLGIFVTPISWSLVVFVWLWSFVWMQIGELAKRAYFKVTGSGKKKK